MTYPRPTIHRNLARDLIPKRECGFIVPGVVAGGGGGAPPPYHANAVQSDGTAQFLTDTVLTATDNEFCSFAFWFNIASIDGFGEVWVTDPAGDFTNSFDLSPGGPWLIPHYKTENPPDSGMYDDITQQIDAASLFGSWHSIISTAQTNLSAGNKKLVSYIDGVLSSGSIGDADAAFSGAWNNLALSILNDTFGDGYVGAIADLWLAPGQSLLTGSIIAPSTLAKFRDPITGKPIYLGANGELPTGIAPAVFGSGNKDTFLQPNLGTGGTFTLTGTLTNASSSPSD